MESNYTDNPHNFNEIEPYIIMSKEEIVQEVITSGKCYFYDACSFRKHVHFQHPEFLFDFIKMNSGIIVITRCVLMELASHSGILDGGFVEYIKTMWESDLKVLVMYEEDIFTVLSLCFTTNAVINNYLSLAVKVVKTPTGTIHSTLEKDEGLLNDVVKENVSDSSLFNRFFHEVRDNKESGDNLGEELIAVCIHMLSNIPENHSYKYIVLTEDKGAVGLFNKVSDNVYSYCNKYTISAMTTVKLVQRMYEENIILQKTDVEEMLSVGMVNDIVKVLCSEEYDLEPKQKTMTCSELAEKIVIPNAIHINY